MTKSNKTATGKKPSNIICAEIDKERIEAAADSLLNEIKANDTRWQKSWTAKELQDILPCNAVNHNIYKGSNTWLSALELPCNKFITFKQYKELKVNYPDFEMKKGTKGYRITFAKAYSFTKNAENDGTDTDNSDDENVNTRTFIKRWFYTVFNLDDFENVPKHLLEQLKQVENTVIEQNNLIEKCLKAAKINIVHRYQDRAYFSPLENKVYIPESRQFADTTEYYATLLHECAHASGHSTRLNRDLSGGFGSISYAKEELIAELSAFYLCAMFKVGFAPKNLNNNRAYLKDWLAKTTKKESKRDILIDVLKQVDKVLKFFAGFIKDDLYKSENMENAETKNIKPESTKKTTAKKTVTKKTAVKTESKKTESKKTITIKPDFEAA